MLIYLFFCNVMFSFQTILPGTQWFSCETTGESDCATVHWYSSICVVVLSAGTCLPSSRVSAIQTPAPRWLPPSSGSFSVLLTRPLKRPVRPAVAQLSIFSHEHIYVAENGINMCVLLLCHQCPAIDYTRHTLDGAACLLNSNKYFPSRSVF